MVLQIKTDYIISPTKGDYALIDHIEAIPSVAYCYRARLIENSLSEALITLCKEYQECIDAFSILLADEIEREISEYQLCLKYNNSKLFDLKIYDHYVTFFTKYRTADGLLYNYRW